MLLCKNAIQYQYFLPFKATVLDDKTKMSMITITEDGNSHTYKMQILVNKIQQIYRMKIHKNHHSSKERTTIANMTNLNVCNETVGMR